VTVSIAQLIHIAICRGRGWNPGFSTYSPLGVKFWSLGYLTKKRKIVNVPPNDLMLKKRRENNTNTTLLPKSQSARFKEVFFILYKKVINFLDFYVKYMLICVCSKLYR
jgi:hypothetical protein